MWSLYVFADAVCPQFFEHKAGDSSNAVVVELQLKLATMPSLIDSNLGS